MVCDDRLGSTNMFTNLPMDHINTSIAESSGRATRKQQHYKKRYESSFHEQIMDVSEVNCHPQAITLKTPPAAFKPEVPSWETLGIHRFVFQSTFLKRNGGRLLHIIAVAAGHKLLVPGC